MQVKENPFDDAAFHEVCYEQPDLWIGGLLAKPNGREIFAAALERLLAKDGRPASKLAEFVGVTPAMVTHWRNRRNPPNVDQMTKIAEFYGVSLSHLMWDPSDSKSTGMTLDTALSMVAEAVRKAKEQEK